MSKKNRTEKVIEELEAFEADEPAVVNAIAELRSLRKALGDWLSYDYGLPFGSYEEYVVAAEKAKKAAAIAREHWGLIFEP